MNGTVTVSREEMLMALSNIKYFLIRATFSSHTVLTRYINLLGLIVVLCITSRVYFV